MFKQARFITIVFLVLCIKISAQTFGFGCLGLSGFYAGFSEYRFEAPAISAFANAQIQLHNPAQATSVEFGKATGYRVGANIFRAKWDKFFISTKGYYQFLKEEISQPFISGGEELKYDYKLNLNHWGLAADLGVPLFWILDWKIIEGSVTIFQIDFDQQLFSGTKQISEKKFSSNKTKVGYYFGTGLILHLVPDYISMEGTIAYNNIELDQLTGDDGNSIPVSTSTKRLIEKGIWSATLQLNIGVPF